VEDDMGYRFNIQHINLVAYVTSSRVFYEINIPSSSKRDILDLLGGINEHPECIISQDRYWVNSILSSSDYAFKEIYHNKKYNWEDIIDKDDIKLFLEDVRNSFGKFYLFCLSVGFDENKKGFNELVKLMAERTEEKAIVLIPEYNEKRSEYGNIIDAISPLPLASVLASHPERWPGLLLWTLNSDPIFVPYESCFQLITDMFSALKRGKQDIDKVISSYKITTSSKKILHLSDLHFGDGESISNQNRMMSHLGKILPNIDRIVITGDLFNNPKRNDMLLFRAFRDSLQRETQKDVIVIPGNHDIKLLGNVGLELRQIANIEWSKVVIDDDIMCSFSCFNSSIDSNFAARGKITTQQIQDMADAMESKFNRNRDLEDKYLRIALIHHHPFSFEGKPETKLQKILGWFKLKEEDFLKMEDAEKFLTWCADWNISIVLHGHKHIQRYHPSIIQDSEGKSVDIISVGCGASLGAEGYPMSYNIISWDHLSKKWSTSFFSSIEGGPFKQRAVAL
jgi:predicted phosphodiesterase